jgi:hypothetical protein
VEAVRDDDPLSATFILALRVPLGKSASIVLNVRGPAPFVRSDSRIARVGAKANPRFSIWLLNVESGTLFDTNCSTWLSVSFGTTGCCPAALWGKKMMATRRKVNKHAAR